MGDERIKKARAEWREQKEKAALERRLFELIAEVSASPFKLFFFMALALVLLALWLVPWQ